MPGHASSSQMLCVMSADEEYASLTRSTTKSNRMFSDLGLECMASIF